MNNDLNFKEWLVMMIVIFAVIGLIRGIWAKLVYNDLRCVFAECRLMK